MPRGRSTGNTVYFELDACRQARANVEIVSIFIGLRLQWKSPTPFQVWLGPPLKFAKEFPHESHRGQINRRPPRLRDHRAPAYAVELTMDLNHFYSQHQVALIRASAATDRRARPRQTGRPSGRERGRQSA